MAIWGAMNTMFSVIWMSQNVDDAPEAAGSLMVAALLLIGNGRKMLKPGNDL